MLKRMLPVLSALMVIGACFFPWVEIPGQNIVIGGWHSDIDYYGKPGLMHIIITGLYLLFVLVYKIWSLRAAFFLGAFNLGWLIRNYFLLSTCRGGECPLRLPAFYCLIAGVLLMLIAFSFIKTGNNRELTRK